MDRVYLHFGLKEFAFNLLCVNQIDYPYVLFKNVTWLIKNVMWLKIHVDNLFNYHVVSWMRIPPNRLEVNYLSIASRSFHWPRPASHATLDFAQTGEFGGLSLKLPKEETWWRFSLPFFQHPNVVMDTKTFLPNYSDLIVASSKFLVRFPSISLACTLVD